MRVPLVAVVGRPNVGKSTLVNRLAGGRRAIVHHEAGVTRDRHYVSTEWQGRRFETIDTGGLEPASDAPIPKGIARQVELAAKEADLILLVVDARDGLLPGDEESADTVRRTRKCTLLVVNKLDDPSDEAGAAVFAALGFGEPVPVSAAHGTGVGELLDRILEALPAEEEEQAPQDDEVPVAIVGRPNVGKSSLVNRLVQKERMLVSDLPGTTRDAVDTVLAREERRYRLIDTAGLRRRAGRGESLEYYSLVRTLRALDRAQVAAILVDASDAVTEQDQRIAEMAVSHRCGIVVALNKWDLLQGDPARKETIRGQLSRKFRFASYAPVVTVSALSGKGLEGLLETVDHVHEVFHSRVATKDLNAFLQSEALSQSGVIAGGKRLKASYVTQTGTGPPVFTFFANRPEAASTQLKRQMENSLRRAFRLEGVPVEIRFRKK